MTDYNTQQRRRNIIVGLFVLVAFILSILMLDKFRDLPLFISKASSFDVIGKFTDAPGVQRDTPIQFCGYQIGRVAHVSSPTYVEDPATGKSWHEINVTMAIDKKFKNIPSNIKLMLMKRGLGSSYIELRADPKLPLTPQISGRPETQFLCDKMVIHGSLGMSSEFFPPEMQDKLEHLVISISTLAENTNQIIGDVDNKTNIKKTLEHVAVATEQARQTLASVQQFSDVGSEKITQIAENLDGVVKEFHQILVKINSGQGSAGRFINDGRFYENLMDSSAELEMALEQVKKWAADAREKGIRIKW
jgi:ABC-type transporter Mla subunit MlaD